MGVGYDLMTSALRGETAGVVVLALVFLKMFATAVTLGSGGSGGVFSPSLLLGALTGVTVGTLVNLVLPAHLAAEPGAYALVGMGAVVAATTHAPITAIVILFELTGEYEIILPLMIACTISTLLAMRLRQDSIYTIRLSARGRRVRFGQELNVLRSIDVRSVMRSDRIETVSESTPFNELIRLMVRSPEAYFYVLDEERNLSGVLSVHDLRRMLEDAEHVGSLLVAADVATRDVLTVRGSETLDQVMRLFGRESIEVLPVVGEKDPRRLVGTIHRRDVVAAYNREMFRRDAAGELAEEIGHVSVSRIVEISGGFGLLEVEAPAEFVGWTLGGLGVRARHGVDVLLIRRPSADGEDEGDRGTPSCRRRPPSSALATGFSSSGRRSTSGSSGICDVAPRGTRLPAATATGVRIRLDRARSRVHTVPLRSSRGARLSRTPGGAQWCARRDRPASEGPDGPVVRGTRDPQSEPFRGAHHARERRRRWPGL
jgi:CIC family chloride channel protein